MIRRLISKIKDMWFDFKVWRNYKKKLKKLKEEDPFIYR